MPPRGGHTTSHACGGVRTGATVSGDSAKRFALQPTAAAACCLVILLPPSLYAVLARLAVCPARRASALCSLCIGAVGSAVAPWCSVTRFSCKGKQSGVSPSSRAACKCVRCRKITCNKLVFFIMLEKFRGEGKGAGRQGLSTGTGTQQARTAPACNAPNELLLVDCGARRASAHASAEGACVQARRQQQARCCPCAPSPSPSRSASSIISCSSSSVMFSPSSFATRFRFCGGDAGAQRTARVSTRSSTGHRARSSSRRTLNEILPCAAARAAGCGAASAQGASHAGERAASPSRRRRTGGTPSGS